MMNKKLFSIIPIALLVMGVFSVSAIDMPMIAYGKVVFDGVTYANQEVEVYSPLYDASWVVKTNENGVYQASFNNMIDDFNRKLRDGDTVKMRACPPEVNSACEKTVVVSDVPQEINWGIDDSNANDLVSDDAIDVKDVTPTPVPTAAPIIPVVCSDCGDCICPGQECPACPECKETSCDVPEEDRGVFWLVVTGLLAGAGGLGIGGYFIKKKEALGIGLGVKIYTKRDGTEGVLHKHPGIRGYHNPNTSHRDVRERHLKGETDPTYKKDSEGVWRYVE